MWNFYLPLLLACSIITVPPPTQALENQSLLVDLKQVASDATPYLKTAIYCKRGLSGSPKINCVNSFGKGLFAIL